jgi:hypothetical protein
VGASRQGPRPPRREALDAAYQPVSIISVQASESSDKKRTLYSIPLPAARPGTPQRFQGTIAGNAPLIPYGVVIESVLGLDSRAMRSLRWSFRSRLAEYRPYLALARQKHGHAVITDETELVIDGFTRTASTFAVIAFQLAQPKPVRLAHHLHAPSQILDGIQRGKPVLLTIREPEASVLSCVVREPYVSLHQALTAYARFYERLAPWRSGYVLGEFEEVTANFGAVIERVNVQFGTTFAPFAPSPDNVAHCLRIIEERSRRPPWEPAIGLFLSGLATAEDMWAAAASQGSGSGGTNEIPERRVARPSAGREALKEPLREIYRSAALSALRRRAERVYAELASRTTTPRPAGDTAGQVGQTSARASR